MLFGVQIVSCIIIATILLHYFLNKKMDTFSNKIFSIYLAFSFSNLLFEFMTLWDLYHIDTIVKPAIDVTHLFFLATLVVAIFFFFLYLDAKARGQRRYSAMQYALRFIPMIVALCFVLFGDIAYYTESDGVYSYGPKTYSIYIAVVGYLTFSAIQIIRYRKSFRRQEILAFMLGIGVWGIIAVLQITHRVWLLSSLGLSFMTLLVYLSFENPREYNDYEIEGTFNQYALDTFLNELLQRKKCFYVVDITLRNTVFLKSTIGTAGINEILKDMADTLERELEVSVYHPKRYCITAILQTEKQKTKLMNTSFDFMHEAEGGIRLSPQYSIALLSCPEFADSKEDIHAMLEFAVTQIPEEQKSLYILGDEDIEKKKQSSVIEKVIQQAIDDRSFQVYYQPIYSGKDKQFVSAEALVRLKDPETDKFIPPDIFIPMAEKNGQISEVGNIVFENVCRFIRDNKPEQYGVKYIEVNLSGIQCVDQNLKNILMEYVEKYKLSPEVFNLEITETAAVNMEERLRYNMRVLRECGFKFAMDDFGTGYSNLAKMAKSDFELIKLDRSLIVPCFEKDKDGEAEVVLNSCIDMVLRLGGEIVAEGVETEEQNEYLLQRGVNYIQGYYHSRPLPEDQYLAFLKERSARG